MTGYDDEPGSIADTSLLPNGSESPDPAVETARAFQDPQLAEPRPGAGPI